MTESRTPIDLNVAKVRRFCDRKIPRHLRDQLRWEVTRRGHVITIHERRPPWPGAPDPKGPWTKREIAQFRTDAADPRWTLYWAGQNGRWLRVPDAVPSAEIDGLLAIVDENRTGAFD